MARLASILVSFILLTGQLYNSAIYSYYQYNFDYFANELCENQEQTDLHCDGKCQLAEMLAPAEEDEEPEGPVFQSLPDLFPFAGDRLLPYVGDQRSIMAIYLDGPFSGSLEPISPPPQ